MTSRGPVTLVSSSGAVESPIERAPPGRTDAIILLLYALALAGTVFLNKLAIASVPIRGLLLLAAAALAIGARNASFWSAVDRHRFSLTVLGSFAGIGILVTVLNGVDLATTLRQVLEIHVQGLLILLIGAVVVDAYGPGPIFRVLVACMAVSGAFMLAQALEMSWAWDLRRLLGELQDDAAATAMKIKLHRPLGLSYSAVLFGTQVCLLFGAYWALRVRSFGIGFPRTFSLGVLAALLLVVGLNLLAGNRSPLLGAAAFFFIYFWIAAPRLAIPATLALIGSFFFIPTFLDALAEWGIRAAETEDGSAQGRSTLQIYGMRLFFDRPLGYGLAFDPGEHWPAHWMDFRQLDNALAIQTHALHNCYLNLLNKYGVAAVIVAVAMIPKLLSNWALLLGFVPYLVHAYYHNDGPLQGDALLWAVIAILPSSEMQRRVSNVGRLAIAKRVSASAIAHR